MGIPDMACTGNGLVDMRQPMVTLADHFIDSTDINLVIRVFTELLSKSEGSWEQPSALKTR